MVTCGGGTGWGVYVWGAEGERCPLDKSPEQQDFLPFLGFQDDQKFQYDLVWHSLCANGPDTG